MKCAFAFREFGRRITECAKKLLALSRRLVYLECPDGLRIRLDAQTQLLGKSQNKEKSGRSPLHRSCGLSISATAKAAAALSFSGNHYKIVILGKKKFAQKRI